MDRRVAVGTCPHGDRSRIISSWCGAVTSSAEPSNWTAALQDGRTIQMRLSADARRRLGLDARRHHRDFGDSRAAANDRISLQTLIDWVPDNLWVKDIESRFVIANKATALRMGFAKPEDLIGKTDLELCHAGDSPAIFRRRAEGHSQSGQPMIDKEEVVVASAKRHGSRRRKCRCATKKNEIFGLVGVSRDITERRQADRLRDAQAEILEMIATSAPLETVLDRLVRARRISTDGDIRLHPAARPGWNSFAARRGAEPG